MKVITHNIAEYMSALGNRKYTAFDVSIISKAIRIEYEDRKQKHLEIKIRTSAGRKQIKERVAVFANELVKNNRYSFNDILLYRKCCSEEYESRTGKCAWGYKEKRIQLGYDPNTGLPI